MGNLFSFSPTPSASEESSIRPNPKIEEPLGDIVISSSSSENEEEEEEEEEKKEENNETE